MSGLPFNEVVKLLADVSSFFGSEPSGASISTCIVGQEGVHIDERFKLSICPLPIMVRETNRGLFLSVLLFHHVSASRVLHSMIVVVSYPLDALVRLERNLICFPCMYNTPF